MATKMTIATKFDETIKVLAGEPSQFSVEDAIEFLKDRKDKAVAKAGSKKETARQVENEGLKVAILDALDGADEGKTVTEILSAPAVASFETESPLTNQRVTAVLRLMITNDGSVRKEKVGKAMKYFVA
jgi:hypothetical protein